MTQEVKLMVGISGSGKSTWVEKERIKCQNNLVTAYVVSRDVIRFSCLQPGEEYFSHEDEVFEKFIQEINKAIEEDFEVIFVDATHLSPKARRKVLSRLKPKPYTNLTFEVIDTHVATALNHNLKRTGRARVPNRVIKEMASIFSIPTKNELPKNKYGFNHVQINIHREEDDAYDLGH